MLSFCTIVWGEMTESYLKATLPSLLQPCNLPTCGGLLGLYEFYASEEARSQITANPQYRLLESHAEIRWLPLQKGEWHVNSNILHHMEMCAEEDYHAALLPPDVVFGNGSLLNLALLAEAGHNPILWGYPKVDGEGFEVLKRALRLGPISNRHLVSMAMGHIVGASYEITPVGPGEWLVSQRVPAPCVRPDHRVLEIYRANPAPNGGHDHVLPYRLVKEGYPWHLIHDSDQYFQAELSTGWAGFDTDSGPRAWEPGLAEEAEVFFKQFTQTWRGGV